MRRGEEQTVVIISVIPGRYREGHIFAGHPVHLHNIFLYLYMYVYVSKVGITNWLSSFRSGRYRFERVRRTSTAAACPPRDHLLHVSDTRAYQYIHDIFPSPSPSLSLSLIHYTYIYICTRVYLYNNIYIYIHRVVAAIIYYIRRLLYQRWYNINLLLLTVGRTSSDLCPQANRATVNAERQYA